MRKILKIVLVIAIAIGFLTPVSMVIADDTEPPVISSISYGPHAGVRTDSGFYLYQSCNVTDNVSVADVKINITGPVGFTSLNVSMENISASGYYYEIENVSVSGTYNFFIWAIDTSNNTAKSNTYHMLVFETYLSYIYVDVNNTVGPWNGSATSPLQYINDALAVIANNGTIFVNEGLYSNTSISISKNMSFIGENQFTTILDGGGSNSSIIVQLDGNLSFALSNFTLRNAAKGLQIQNGENATVSQCTFFNCSNSGLTMLEYQYLLVTNCIFQDNNRGIQFTNCSNNQFYHNNFLDNTIQVSSYSNTSNNTWDNNITGNYWDNYQIVYPNASIIPSTGTWDTPYLVNTSGNNTDNHPWVYPNGYIDTIPPGITVVYPNGGEIVSGNITIEWVASDDLTTDLNGTIRIEYSADNGSNWTELASGYDNTGVYLWDTTTVLDGDGYYIRVNASDDFLNIGSDTSNTSFLIINNWNYPPGSLNISGPSTGANGIVYNFTVNAIDPEGEQIYYQWDWGDLNTTDWLGPYNSSEPSTISYAWASDGNYSMRVRARDISGVESNWSAVHSILIQPLVAFTNMKLGYIYIKLFSYNRSYIYSNFLERLRIVILFSSHEMDVEAWATDTAESVVFRAENLFNEYVPTTEIVDDTPSNGFSAVFNVSRGIYELNVTAYDGNGTVIDRYSLPTVLFLRVGKYALGPEGTLRQTGRILSRLRH